MPAQPFSRFQLAPTIGPEAEHRLSEPAFTSPEGLRALLNRLHDAGEGAWRSDREASLLLAFTIDKYAGLARKWNREPEDAATAAFLAMQNDSARTAADPWAVVTRAVQVTLMAENHADKHLISIEKARRLQNADLDAPARAGELIDNLDPARATIEGGSSTEYRADPVVENTIRLLVLLGWPVTIGAAVEYITARLADAGSIPAAYEALRRDAAIRAQLDLARKPWKALLEILLGSRPQPGRPTRLGVLARLLSDEDVRDLLDDNELVAAILTARPSPTVFGGELL